MVGAAGYTSARAHQAATLASRRAKEHGVDADVLQARWRDEAAALGFGPEEVAACFDQSPARGTTDLDALFRSMAGPAGLTRHARTFRRTNGVAAVTPGPPGAPAKTTEPGEWQGRG